METHATSTKRIGKGKETVERQNQIPCQCEAGQCFLAEDSAWTGRNYADSSIGHGLRQNPNLLDKLEWERLQRKDAWLNRLGVSGTSQVICRCFKSSG